MSNGARQIIAGLPEPAKNAFHFVRRRVVSPLLPRAPLRAFPQTRNICVSGLLTSSSGLGKSARLCAAELKRLGWRVVVEDVAGDYREKGEVAAPFARAGGDFQGVKIWHLNPPMLLPTIARHAPHRLFRTYNIGYWAWEFDVVPDDWVGAARLLDAVFVTSEFTAQALRPRIEAPVFVVHHPIEARPSGFDWRAKLGVPADAFLALTCFNYGSAFERKNPLAAVKSFLHALCDEPSAHLAVKSSDPKGHREDHTRLMRIVRDHPRIHFIEEALEDADMMALIGAADCLLSLHRSEGFGLPIAEAMSLGVPTVATRWSGNLDFSTPETAMLVDCRVIPAHVRHSHLDGVRRLNWADPDTACGARRLRRLFDDRAYGRSLAAAAKRELAAAQDRFSYARALDRLAARPVSAATVA